MRVSRFPLWMYPVDVGSESYVTQASVSTFNFQAQALKSQISPEAVRQAKKKRRKSVERSLTEPYRALLNIQSRLRSLGPVCQDGDVTKAVRTLAYDFCHDPQFIDADPEASG